MYPALLIHPRVSEVFNGAFVPILDNDSNSVVTTNDPSVSKEGKGSFSRPPYLFSDSTSLLSVQEVKNCFTEIYSLFYSRKKGVTL